MADVISFGVAPAVLGFAIGLQGLFDCLILLYFGIMLDLPLMMTVNCGVSRLARYNATAEKKREQQGGKIRYFEGAPIPSTVLTAMIVFYLVMVGSIGDGNTPGGKWVVLGWSFHPFSLLYALNGTLLVSQSLIIPKP